MHDGLVRLYELLYHASPQTVTALSPHASNRFIYRLNGIAGSVIGVVNQNRFENRAFLELSAHFAAFGLPVPKILATDPEAGLYLEEDLGDTTLYDVLTARRSSEDPFPHDIEELYRRILVLLPRFQIEAGATLNYDVCHPRRAYDREAMLWDMRFFRESFIRRTVVRFDDARLEADFERLADFLGQAKFDYFMYRDLQSRNIMVKGETLFFIDYQGGRRGPLQYDVASLLYQGKAGIPAAARLRLLNGYLDEVEAFTAIDRPKFVELYYGFVMVRLLQVLGTYGEQGLNQRKSYFVESIPLALANVKSLVVDALIIDDLPEIRRVFDALFEMHQIDG